MECLAEFAREKRSLVALAELELTIIGEVMGKKDNRLTPKTKQRNGKRKKKARIRRKKDAAKK